MESLLQGQKAWRGRDWTAAVALFVATAGAVLWQCAHVAVLWDISYMLDSSWRMALGQAPYRDFPFVHAPLTFLLQAAVMRVGGREFFHHVVYAAMVAGMATVVAWRVVLGSLQGRTNGGWGMSVLLAMPLVVLGVYGIFPTPFYDCDCVALVVVAVWMLGRVSRDGESSVGWAFGAGVASVLPVFCKQNIGAPFLLVVVLGAAVLWGARREPAMGWVVAGVGVGMGIALGLLQVWVGLRNYWYWTVTFAGQRRLPGMAEMVGVYREPTLAWTLPCVLVGAWLLGQGRWSRIWVTGLGVALVVAPLVMPVWALFVSDDAEDRAGSLLALWPLLLVLAAGHAVWRLWRREWGGVVELAILAAIQGTMLSQQLWGSTYAIWPLFMVLLAGMLGRVVGQRRWVGRAIAVTVGVVLLVCGGLYARSEDRLSYARVEEGAVVRPKVAELKGMSVRGEYMPEFEELLEFAAKEIPRDDAVVLLPGEDPFYFATGRVPRFPVLLFDRTTDPYSAEELMEQMRGRDVRWVIVKTRLQLKEDPTPEGAKTLELVRRDYGMYRRLDGYEVWRRR